MRGGFINGNLFRKEAVDNYKEQFSIDRQITKLSFSTSFLKPIDIKVNNTAQIVINEGEAVNLSMTYAPAERYNNITPSYYTEDTGIATIVDNQLVGVSAGNTTLVASAQPYGSTGKVEVIVNAAYDTTETTTVSANRGGGSGGSLTVKSAAAKAETEVTTENGTEVTTESIAIESSDKFIDISEHWAREIINVIADKNIVNGYEDNTFKPNNSITRAEFLTILYNSGLADTADIDSDISFADVTGNEWYYDYIKWGVENNLIVGYDDNTFRGNNIISRQEMAVVISKFIELSDINLDETEAVIFADADNIAPWAKEYVNSISAYGIVKGDNNNCYLPNKDLTRAETAVIINQLTQ